MPSKSQAQHNAMQAAAHGGSTLGIPKKVGAEFAKADKGRKFSTKHVAAALRKKHAEPDMDERGGTSDMDQDNY